MMRSRVAQALLACTLVVGGASSATTTEATTSDAIHAVFAAAAQRAGMNLEAMAQMRALVQTWGADGTRTTSLEPFGQAIGRRVPWAPFAAAEALGGLPEYLAGNTTHIFADAYFGETRPGLCPGATVTTSAVAPSTPFVLVTGAPLYATPVPGLLSPVVPPTSWATPAYLAGGPVHHIKGSYAIGFHTAGTLLGSGASTATGAPGGAPVWLPMVHGVTFLPDSSIDFVGQAVFEQVTLRLELLGYTLCFALGIMPLSSGVAIFDNAPIQGVAVELPDVP